MNQIIRSLAIGMLFLLAAACAPDVDPDVKRVAAFYVDRYNDTTPVDTTDTAFVPELEISREELDSLTIDWTDVEWTQFWKEVKKARKP